MQMKDRALRRGLFKRSFIKKEIEIDFFLKYAYNINMCGSRSMVEHQLPKLAFAGSIPVSRSTRHSI